MKFIKPTLNFLSLFALFCTLGCQTQKAKPNPELLNIELLRGDILLCGSGDFGNVKFSLSCGEATQETFELALSLLHSFEYTEAEKAFVKVIDTDPECAMAYWGVAMSIFHSLWMQSDLSYLEKGSKLLKIAASLPKTERETAYLDAIQAFYKDSETVDKKTRKLNYEKKMEVLSKKYDDDVEAAIFYALALRVAADPTDKTYKKQKESGQILEDLFKENPNHPGIAHYIIHNYDYPELAELGLETARSYAKIAPASSHAQHMPSHIFTRMGLWEESINSNISSTASALCYSENLDQGHWDEELHGMDYLVYAYLQIGDNKKAIEQFKYLQSFKNVFPQNFKIAYTATAIPARIALENKNWSAATKLGLPPFDFPWDRFPWQKAIMHFAKAMGYSQTGDIPSAEKELQTLKSLHQELVEMEDAYKANQVLIQIKTADAWINFAKGNHEEAIALMIKAVEMEDNTSKHAVTPGEILPARELLGDLLLAMNKPSEALEAYEKDLKNHPSRFNGIYGAAIASQKMGNNEKAKSYFEKLIVLTENTKSDRPEIEEARAFISQI